MSPIKAGFWLILLGALSTAAGFFISGLGDSETWREPYQVLGFILMSLGLADVAFGTAFAAIGVVLWAIIRTLEGNHN